jgi:hypothetical protein
MITATTKTSGIIRVHPESASQMISSRLWIVPREARSRRRRRSSRSFYRRNAHGIQVPIMRQLIVTTSGELSAIPAVARRTRSPWTKNPKKTTKGTKGATRSFRMLRRSSTSFSGGGGGWRLRFQAGTKTASSIDHVRQAGCTMTTPLVEGIHLILPR